MTRIRVDIPRLADFSLIDFGFFWGVLGVLMVVSEIFSVFSGSSIIIGIRFLYTLKIGLLNARIIIATVKMLKIVEGRISFMRSSPS